MFIHEAVKEAIEKDLYIRRKRWPAWIMKPTNTSDCVMCVFENKMVRCWNPQANDLAADDWEVVDIKDPVISFDLIRDKRASTE